MLWTIIILVVVIVIVSFFKDVNKDNSDLSGQTLSEKFKYTVATINASAFGGLGTITLHDKREFNLYKIGENQIIIFTYGTGHLTIKWKYKYFQKEIEHSKIFPDVRNLSVFEQQEIGNIMIREMNDVIKKHQNSIVPNNIGSKPINQVNNDIDKKLELLFKQANSQTSQIVTRSFIETQLNNLIEVFSKNELSELQIGTTFKILENHTLIANSNKIILNQSSTDDFSARYTVYFYFFYKLRESDKYLSIKSLMPGNSLMHPTPNRSLINRISRLDNLIETKTGMSFKIFCLGTL